MTAIIAIVCLVGAPVVYGVIVAWPQRIPQERTVAAIRTRIETEGQR